MGAPDPEHRTSPILSRPDDRDEPSRDSKLESGTCYVSDRRLAIGDDVRGGDELLHCAEHGVWLKVMESPAG